MTWPPDASDPLVWAAGAGVLLLLWLLIRAGRSSALTELQRGQERLAGGLAALAEAQAAAQARMADGIAGDAARTAHALGAVEARLSAIDRAQARIEALSDDVLGLQDILANKQARGVFGEIQLADILAKALPPDAYSLQATLSNGRRADALVHLPEPPGPVAVDSKFPLEAWEALRRADTERARTEAARALRRAVLKHVDDIAERYLVEGETAGQALMFLPSEAIYADLHAEFGDAVRAGFARKVWIVSPTTLMAVLTTMRGVMRDARMQAEAGRMRREIGLLAGDVARLADRVGKLDMHLRQAGEDISAILVSAEKAGRRAERLEAVDFGEPEAGRKPAA